MIWGGRCRSSEGSWPATRRNRDLVRHANAGPRGVSRAGPPGRERRAAGGEPDGLGVGPRRSPGVSRGAARVSGQATHLTYTLA
jgi:hypothetical protein